MMARTGALSRRNDDPQTASRPFDKDRDGFLFGEGAGIRVAVRIALQFREEPFVVPHVDRVVLPEDVHVARDAG